MFDLNSKKLADTLTFQLIDPTGEALFADDEQLLPIELEIYGKSSKQYKTWAASANRKSLANKNKVYTQDEIAENTANWLVAITKQANNLVVDGTAVTTAEQFKAIYMNPEYEWVGDAIAEKLNERGAFLQK